MYSAYGNVWVMRGRGDGSFERAAGFPAGLGPTGVTVSDFNGDGNMDLAVTNGNSHDVSVLLGNGDETFRPALNFAIDGTPSAVVAGNLSGDGKQDLAITDSLYNQIVVLMGNGDGTFRAPAGFALGNGPGLVGPSSMVMGDFNGDAAMDLAVANPASNTASVLINNSR
jgi:hypothetical protein